MAQSTAVTAAATPDQARALHALRWERPEGLAWIPCIERALARLEAAQDDPHGHLYQALLYGTSAGGKARQREKRSDGGANAIALLCAMLVSADVSSGLVARPVGGLWERKRWDDLDRYAFGELVPGARSSKRTQRAAEALAEAGLIRCVRWKRATIAGYREAPGLKFVTEKLYKLLGVWSAVRAERRRRKAEAAKAVVDNLVGNISKSNSRAMRRDPRPTGPMPIPPAATPARAGASDKQGQAPPGRDGPTSAGEHIARIKQLLGVR